MTTLDFSDMRNITMGYDAKRALCNLTGLGNYSRFTIESVKAVTDANLLLYSPKVNDTGAIASFLAEGGERYKLRTPKGVVGGALWRSFGITCDLRNDKVDLYHGLSNELPINIKTAGIPSVVTIHDLIWRRIPQDYSYIDRHLDDWKYRHSAINATRIIAISERTKSDLVNDYGIDPAKIDVIYQGCNKIFSQPVADSDVEEVMRRYGLPDRYILAVGTVESRKNQLLAVKGLAGLPDDVKLVIIGRDRRGYGHSIMKYAAANRLANRVIWLQGLPLAELPALYTGASIVSYTSRYEGFGLPVIEALTVGTPVIAATGSCLEEAGGPGAIYVDPDNIDDYVSAASQLLTTSSTEMVSAGQQHVARFNTSDYAAQILATYRRALD